MCLFCAEKVGKLKNRNLTSKVEEFLFSLNTNNFQEVALTLSKCLASLAISLVHEKIPVKIITETCLKFIRSC